jgi:hypothetical protein
MTRIKVFKTSLIFSRFFIIFGITFSILGFILIIRALAKGFDTRFPSGDWNSVIYTVQGLLFIIMGTSNLINRKYYIEWDENELRFYLSETKKPEVLKIDDIVIVNIKLFEINVGLIDRTVNLRLDNLQFEDLRKIKEMFEKMKK